MYINIIYIHIDAADIEQIFIIPSITLHRSQGRHVPARCGQKAWPFAVGVVLGRFSMTFPADLQLKPWDPAKHAPTLGLAVNLGSWCTQGTICSRKSSLSLFLFLFRPPLSLSLSLYVYIYIYTLRERETERDVVEVMCVTYMHLFIYIYIYTLMYTHTHIHKYIQCPKHTYIHTYIDI